jgi:hypothetical protein
MLTTSFANGLNKFTDGIFIFPSVRMDTDGRNNFTKLTVGMLAAVLDNPLEELLAQRTVHVCFRGVWAHKGQFTLHNLCLKLSHATCLQLSS